MPNKPMTAQELQIGDLVSRRGSKVPFGTVTRIIAPGSLVNSVPVTTFVVFYQNADGVTEHRHRPDTELLVTRSRR